MDDIKRDPFEEYIKNLPPTRKEMGQAWSAAIGLQDVDGLKPSKYLSVREILAQLRYSLSNISDRWALMRIMICSRSTHGISGMLWYGLITAICKKVFTKLRNIWNCSCGICS